MLFCDVKLKTIMPLIDLCSSLNIMTLSMPEVMDIPLDKIIEQPIKVLDFGGNAFFTLDYFTLNLTWAYASSRLFLCHWSQTSYHLLLWRPWIHKHKAWKPFRNARKSTPMPLNVHSREMKLFSRGSILWRVGWGWRDRPWGVPLSIWEDLEKQMF